MSPQLLFLGSICRKKCKTPAHAGDIKDAGSIMSQEDPLEEDMTTHSSILAWEMLWTEESGGLLSMGWTLLK